MGKHNPDSTGKSKIEPNTQEAKHREHKENTRRKHWDEGTCGSQQTHKQGGEHTDLYMHRTQLRPLRAGKQSKTERKE